MPQKQDLRQKQVQHLSVMQIELMKLITVPSSEIQLFINNVLDENPILEKAESRNDHLDERSNQDIEPTISNEKNQETYLFDDEGEMNYDNANDDFIPELGAHKEIIFKQDEDIHKYLQEQLLELHLNERELLIATYIIGNLEDDGYLKLEIQNIIDDIAFKENLEIEQSDVEIILKQIQNLEPAGIGARNVQECLLLQLQRGKQEGKLFDNAIQIIEKYFDAFSKKKFNYIQQDLRISNADLENSIKQITNLNPKPLFSIYEHRKPNQFITPDFFVTETNGSLHLALHHFNDIELIINSSFQSQLKEYQSQPNKKKKDAALFLKQKIESAKWFIELLDMRKKTLLDTMKVIMQYQYDFFISGDEQKIKPMNLKDIHNKCGLDISTISRVVNSKYVQTEYGVFSLKFFFNKVIIKNNGDDVTLKKLISDLKEMIDNEDKNAPFTDEALTKLLAEKGYQVQRRSITNYRQELNIPSRSMRKINKNVVI